MCVITGFHLTSCMHDLLEGYLPYCLKLTLSHLIGDCKVLTLNQLNQAIENTDYGDYITSRPHSIPVEALSVANGCAKFPLSGE